MLVSELCLSCLKKQRIVFNSFLNRFHFASDNFKTISIRSIILFVRELAYGTARGPRVDFATRWAPYGNSLCEV